MDQAESLRNIIKKQESTFDKKVARVITVTSGKGGVGKTSLSVNLAIQLQRLGQKVVIMDADFGLANIEIMLGKVFMILLHMVQKVLVSFLVALVLMKWQI